MDKILLFIKLFIAFFQNSIGSVNKPYITYRKLSEPKSDVRQIIYILLITVGYFSFAALVKSGIRNPYLMTMKFNFLVIAFGAGFVLSIFLFYVLGKILKSRFTLKSLILLWGYSLLPTIVWFMITSVLYILLPPPRTFSLLGKFYSIVYIAFSISLFYWKAILYYLTLRFGLKLEFVKILISTAIYIPIVLIFTFITYKAGIFRIPFI
jgi:hypothetical protein